MTYDNPTIQAGWVIHRVAQGILVEEGEVLLSGNRWWSGKPLVWTLPGGRAEEGEGVLEALAREFQEETALTVKPGALAFVAEAHSVVRRQIFLTCAFTVTRLAGELSCSEDSAVEELKFVPIEDLPSYLNAPSLRDPLLWHMTHPESNARYWFFPEYTSE